MSKSTKEKVFLGLGIVLIILVGWMFFHTKNTSQNFGAALSCSDGSATCLPTLELTGSANTSLSSLQVDTGASTFAGNVSIAGTLAGAGLTATSLTVTGATSLTTETVATSTMSGSLVLRPTNGKTCVQIYATSTATASKLTFETATTTAISTAGFIGFAYGTCAQ